MSGWRVLVCRAAPDAAATATALVVAGHTAILAPVLDIVTLPVELDHFVGADALLVTSANAIRALRPEQASRLADRPLYAVGKQTAVVARRHGFVDVRVAGGDAASLASLLSLTCPPRARLTYLAGRVRKPDLESTLRAGRRLTVVEVYDAAIAPPWNEAVRDQLADGRVDACLHYSRRSASLAMAFAARADVGTAFHDLVHFCISPDVAGSLREAGMNRIAVADPPEESEVLRLLERYGRPALEAREPSPGDF